MFVYILESIKFKIHYVGITKDLLNRLNYHNSDKVKSTKSKKPWKIIYYEKKDSPNSAREREKFLKSYKGVCEKRQIIKKYSGIVPGRVPRVRGQANGRTK